MKLGRLQQILKCAKRDFILANDTIVIDAKTFFPNTYKNSGCQYILGGEYDRYADYLRNYLKKFKEANVTCYVIFNGDSMKADIETRLEIHKKVICQIDSISPLNKENIFCEPAFLKDVVKHVLDELQIKYVVSENYLTDLINTAKYCHCPIITKAIEYSLFGVACCAPKSLQFDSEMKSFAVKLYDPQNTRQRINSNTDKLAVILVLLDENNDFLDDLRSLIRYPLNRELNATLSWVRRHMMQVILSDISKNLEKTKHERFLTNFNAVKVMLRGQNNRSPTVYRLTGQKRNYKDNFNWYAEGLSSGRIPVSYATLMKHKIISGSWLIFDPEREDAALSAIEIIEFVGTMMSDYTDNNYTFIRRVKSEPQAWEIQFKFVRPNDMPNWKKHPKYWEHIPDLLRYFLNDRVPELDYNVINSAPEECRLLMISLVYYGSNINNEFLYGAYSVLLSYVMLGHVGRVTGLLKRSNLILSQNTKSVDENQKNDDEITIRDSYIAARATIDLFYVDETELKRIFDRKQLHSFAEFQHCLLHMNYLNKFCGEKMKGTVYHATYNATFVYKIFLRFKESEQEPLMVVEELLENSPSVFKFYKKLVQIFHNCCSKTTRIY